MNEKEIKQKMLAEFRGLFCDSYCQFYGDESYCKGCPIKMPECWLFEREFTVGEVFDFGITKLKVYQHSGDDCKGCFLADINSLCCSSMVGPCRKGKRKDNCNVIFKEVKQ